ncbi:hypothetical protein HS5_04530 [Acidianus sp. HS-5]|nr:hypothetical protein HS5_04530 [Acidianus sp. HS-5]
MFTSRFDTFYKKDIRSFRVGKGTIKELRYVIPYGSTITVGSVLMQSSYSIIQSNIISEIQYVVLSLYESL